MSGYDEVAAHYDHYEAHEDRWLRCTGGYHALVRRIACTLVPPGQRVLEIGCGRGDLLSALEPIVGVGVDVSGAAVRRAQARHEHLRFVQSAGEDIAFDEQFDYVVATDVVQYTDDLQALFEAVRRHCHPRTRVVISSYSNVWRPLLRLLEIVRIRPRRPLRNWVAPRDLRTILELAGFDVVSQRNEVLLPVRIPLLSTLVNGILARLPVVRALTLTYWIVARPEPVGNDEASVSVVVPCRNEAGSIDAILERIPELGTHTELVFVEGHSTDGTRERIAEAIGRFPDRDLKLLVQSGVGKGNAVREGFALARGDILVILDADLTVSPEDLPKFYRALISGRGELINGSRLVYEMEGASMRFLNLLGNKLFASLMSFVLGAYVKDTLCGTKALWRADYEGILAAWPELEDLDPFGDFLLLLGASALGLRIVDLPVRYGARRYGATNIKRFSHGGKLARLTIIGFQWLWVRPIRPRRLWSATGDSDRARDEPQRRLLDRVGQGHRERKHDAR